MLLKNLPALLPSPEGIYCIVLHIWRTIVQLKYNQNCEYQGAKHIRDLRAVNTYLGKIMGDYLDLEAA